MKTLNTIKQFNELVTVRVSEIFKADDTTKIDQYTVLASKAADYIVENYPEMESVIKDYNSWKAMCKDVNLQSMHVLELLLTEEEIQQLVVMLDNDEALFAYWTETMSEVEGLEFNMDAELKSNQQTLHGIVASL